MLTNSLKHQITQQKNDILNETSYRLSTNFGTKNW